MSVAACHQRCCTVFAACCEGLRQQERSQRSEKHNSCKGSLQQGAEARAVRSKGKPQPANSLWHARCTLRPHGQQHQPAAAAARTLTDRPPFPPERLPLLRWVAAGCRCCCWWPGLWRGAALAPPLEPVLGRELGQECPLPMRGRGQGLPQRAMAEAQATERAAGAGLAGLGPAQPATRKGGGMRRVGAATTRQPVPRSHDAGCVQSWRIAQSGGARSRHVAGRWPA